MKIKSIKRKDEITLQTFIPKLCRVQLLCNMYRKMLRLYRNYPAVAVTVHTSDLHLQYTVTCEAACDKILFEAL